MGYGLWAMGYGLWAMGYGLWAMGYGLWAMGYGLHQDNASEGSALGHQFLLTPMGNKADGRVGEIGPDGAQAVS
jgi:hypothetical protein